MALSPTLSDPCDGSLEILDRDGQPIVIPDDVVPFFTGGIIPQGTEVLARFNHDHVLHRRLVETLGASTASTSPTTSEGPIVVEMRFGHRSFDEVREVDRAMARRDRDRDRGPAFDGGCVFPKVEPSFTLEAGERVLTRADRPKATARQVAERTLRPRVTAREVAERLENTSTKES